MPFPEFLILTVLFYLQFNLTHHIRHLSFGHEYPGIKHPLDDTFVAAEDGEILFFYILGIHVNSPYFFHSFSTILLGEFGFTSVTIRS